MSGFTNMVGSLYIFLVVKTYPAMAATMTTAGVYWFYASIRFFVAMSPSPGAKPLKLNLIVAAYCPCPLASS